MLYIFNFVVLVGGALGAVEWAACAALTKCIVTSKKLNTGVKVLLNVLLYIGTTIVGVVVALFIQLLRS